MQITMRSARVNAGLTQRELGKKMKVSESTIVHWETGKKIPRADRLFRFCEIVGCDISDIKLGDKS